MVQDQIHKILQSYEYSDCDIMMGDLNLNPIIQSEKERINQICNSRLEMAMNEQTTTDTKNQIDHILVDKVLKGRVFVTSYFNFMSNHKLIVARVGICGNLLKKEILKDLQYPSKKFMKISTDQEKKKIFMKT